MTDARMSTPLTRRDALAAWAEFLPTVGSYAHRRNHVEPLHRNVSRLSAALRYRLLLEDEVVGDTLRHHEFSVAEKWLQEICWRRYWKGWLELRPDVWTNCRRRVRELTETLPDAVMQRVRAVAAGESGVACMDAIARELVATGYLHKHTRMWWASFWIHVERLTWELGADWCFRHLLDADPASNTLSWRWVAGLQTQGKTYLVRKSNIEEYASGLLQRDDAGSDRLADGAVAPVVATVGPVAGLMPRLRQLLTAQGIKLTLVRRASDAHAFSLGGAGFLPFWEKMSHHLNQQSSLSRAR